MTVNPWQGDYAGSAAEAGAVTAPRVHWTRRISPLNLIEETAPFAAVLQFNIQRKLMSFLKSLVEVFTMVDRSRGSVGWLAVLCGLMVWITACAGGTISSNSGGPTPTPTVAPSGHSVAVTWTASSSPGVANYNVYRSTTTGGPYTRVGSEVSGTSFSDTSVKAGTTYFYVVTSVTSSGVESAISSEIKSTVPTP